MDNTYSMYLYVKLNWDANRCRPIESNDCMNSASYEYSNMSARRGAQSVPVRMPIICWKTFPAKTTIMLSTRNSNILMMSSSASLLFECQCTCFSNQSVHLQNRVPRDLKLNICISDFHFCEWAKEKYRGVFEIQRSGDKTSSGEFGLDIRTYASPKVGQDQVSGGVSVLCWHAAPVAYVLWKPCTIG